jgi:hypothetical protein
LRKHDLYGCPRDTLMAVEVELEALPQALFVNLAGTTQPGGESQPNDQRSAPIAVVPLSTGS